MPTLSHYRILEQIGEGGTGVVYRAHDERLDRDVALKILTPGTVVETAARKRFHQEALALSKLNHPNIATVHDFDTQDGTDFLIEELIEGLSLDAMLVSGPLSEKEIIKLGFQLVEGLAAAAVTVVGIGTHLELSLRQSSSGKHAGIIAQGQAVPHESYLAGLKQLERWDKRGNLETAIGLFEQAVKADPGFALGFSALGEAYWAKYRLDHDSRWIDEAERTCKRAAELNSQLPAVYLTLARVHNGKGQYNLALHEIQQI